MNRRKFLRNVAKGLVVTMVPVVSNTPDLGGVGGRGDVDIDFSDGFFEIDTASPGAILDIYDPPTRTATNHWNLKPSDKDTYKIYGYRY